MGYKISKLGGGPICLEGAELGASFQEKWFNFLFCVIQLGKRVCKFQCKHRKARQPQSFLDTTLVLWPSERAQKVAFTEGSSQCPWCLRTKVKQGPLVSGCVELKSQMGGWEPKEDVLPIAEMLCDVFSFGKLLLKEYTAYRRWSWASRMWGCSGSDMMPQVSIHGLLKVCTSLLCWLHSLPGEWSDRHSGLSCVHRPPQRRFIWRVLSGHQCAGQTRAVCSTHANGQAWDTVLEPSWQAHCCHSELRGNRPVNPMRKGSNLLFWAILTGQWEVQQVSKLQNLWNPNFIVSSLSWADKMREFEIL